MIMSPTNIPEESSIRKIYFLENRPNPAGAYPGSYWIISFDGNGQQIETHDHNGVGNAVFDWHEKEQAEQWLSSLEQRTGITAERMHDKYPAKSLNGLIDIFRKN